MNAIPIPSVSVVIPSWNGRMLLEEMFPSLLSATHQFQEKTGGPWEVIVVDDGSVDDTISWIETIPEKNVKLITRRRNSGFAVACNLGFSACRYQVVILLNNDVIVHKDFILPLLPHFSDENVFGVTFKALGRDQRTFCNGGKIGEFRMGFWKAFRNYDVNNGDSILKPDEGPLYSFTVCGGFCAFDRRKLQEIGGFEPLMSPFYWEDVELSYRAWKRGWVIHYEPRSMVYHDASTTVRGAFNRIRIDRINTRNRLIFMWKNLHDPAMLILHLGSMPLLVLQALFTFRVSFFLGLWDSMCCFPAIISKRGKEKRAARVKDSSIKKLFWEFRKKPFVLLK
jgi:GT2 family glycosyltransferase